MEAHFWEGCAAVAAASAERWASDAEEARIVGEAPIGLAGDTDALSGALAASREAHETHLDALEDRLASLAESAAATLVRVVPCSSLACVQVIPWMDPF